MINTKMNECFEINSTSTAFQRSMTLATRVRHERTSATRVLQERHECDMSATRTTQVRNEWKSLILIAARVKTYFYNFIFTIWQVKDHKERNNFDERPFGNASFLCQKAFKKCTTKNSGTSQYNSFSKILQNLKHFLNSRVIV